MNKYLVSYKTNSNHLIIEAENIIHDHAAGEYIIENAVSGTPLTVLRDKYITSVEQIEVKVVM